MRSIGQIECSQGRQRRVSYAVDCSPFVTADGCTSFGWCVKLLKMKKFSSVLLKQMRRLAQGTRSAGYSGVAGNRCVRYGNPSHRLESASCTRGTAGAAGRCERYAKSAYQEDTATSLISGQYLWEKAQTA